MNRLTALAVFAAASCIASTAWACGPSSENMLFLSLFIAPFLALPYTVFGTAVIATQANVWFKRPLRGWFVASLGAWLACTIGGICGFGVAELMEGTVASSNLESTLVLSTPFVFQVAYLMSLHVRRPS